MPYINFLSFDSISPNIKRLIKIGFSILKFAIGIFLLILAFSKVNWNTFWLSFSLLKSEWVVITCITVIIGLFLKVFRFLYLLRSYQVDCSLWTVTQSFFIGQAANIVLPFRGGEIIRFGLLVPGRSGSATEVAASIALEKYLDLLAITLFTFQVLVYLPLKNVSWVGGVLVPTTVLGTVCLIGFILLGPWAWRILKSHPTLLRMRWAGKIVTRIDNLIEISSWLRHPGKLVVLIGITALIWVTMLSTNLLLFQSLQLNLGVEAGILVLVLVYFGLLPALMPGNLGPFYFFAQLALTPFHVASDVSLSFAIILHLIVTLPPLLFGGVMLLFKNTALRDGMQSIFRRGK